MRSGRDRVFQLWGVGLGVLLLATAVWRWFASGAPSGGDGFQYLSHALALLEGRPYGDIGYLYTPLAWSVGPPVYPPGLPLTLAPLFAVFGTASEAPRLLMHGFLLAFVLLVGRYFARESSREVAWGTAALVAAALLLTDRPNVVGSDLGLCAFVWGVLVLADVGGAWSSGRAAAIGLLGAAALLFRVAAAPLVPAGAVVALVRKKSRWMAAAATLLWVGTLLLVSMRFGPGTDPARTMAGGAGGSASGSGRGLVTMFLWAIERLDTKVLRYRFGLTEALLYPFPGDLANDVYHVAALLLAGLGLWSWVRKRPLAFSTVFAAMTVLMLAVIPVSQARYLWVLTPFVAYGFLKGVETLGKGPRAAAIVTAVVIGLSTATAWWTPRTALPSEGGAWTAVVETLNDLPDPPARVASNRPRKVTWYARVPAMPLLDDDLSIFLTEARRLGATHVVLTATGPDDEVREHFEGWVRGNQGLFALVAESGPVQVFKILPDMER